MNFFKAIQLCIKNNLIFAAYRLPNTDSINLVVQKSNVPKKVKITAGLFGNSGFLVSPFYENESNHSYLISSDLMYTSTDYADFDELKTIDAIPHFDDCFENGIISRKDFINQVNGIIRPSRKRDLKKLFYLE